MADQAEEINLSIANPNGSMRSSEISEEGSSSTQTDRSDKSIDKEPSFEGTVPPLPMEVWLHILNWLPIPDRICLSEAFDLNFSGLLTDCYFGKYLSFTNMKKTYTLLPKLLSCIDNMPIANHITVLNISFLEHIPEDKLIFLLNRLPFLSTLHAIKTSLRLEDIARVYKNKLQIKTLSINMPYEMTYKRYRVQDITVVQHFLTYIEHLNFQFEGQTTHQTRLMMHLLQAATKLKTALITHTSKYAQRPEVFSIKSPNLEELLFISPHTMIFPGQTAIIPQKAFITNLLKHYTPQMHCAIMFRLSRNATIPFAFLDKYPKELIFSEIDKRVEIFVCANNDHSRLHTMKIFNTEDYSITFMNYPK